MLYVVQQSLGIEDRKIWESIIASLAGSFVSRLIAGFVCDKYGARLPFAALLVFSCIPTLCLGLVKTALELIIVRFFVGFAGGKFQLDSSSGINCEYISNKIFIWPVIIQEHS